MKFVYATSLIFIFSFTFANAQIGDFVDSAKDAREAIEERFNAQVENREERKESRTKKVDEIKEKIDARIEEIKTRQEERRVELNEKKKERIEKLTEKVFDKLNRLVTRLKDFSTKIEGKISDFENRGVDMSRSLELLEDANDAISVASSSVSDAQVAVDTLLSGEVSKEAIRDLVNVARGDLKLAHTALIEVVKSIKANVKIETDDSSASVEN